MDQWHLDRLPALDGGAEIGDRSKAGNRTDYDGGRTHGEMMDANNFAEDWQALIRPEPDEDGQLPHEYPLPRLTSVYGLDFSYFGDDPSLEGSSTHSYTRLCPSNEERVHALTRNQDVPERLFESALLLFADSLVIRANETNRVGGLRFYPPIILTFWSGFETFVRRASELMIATVTGIPEPVANFLREREMFVSTNGAIKERAKFQSVLDRYAVLLQYGYGWRPDKGSGFWQRLVAAKDLRDYYTHLDINEPRSVTSDQVLEFMEGVLLAIIWPSAALERTLMLGVFHLYEQWDFLRAATEPFTEQPFFFDWHLARDYSFHCNFENVDESRFPNMDQRLERSKTKNSGLE